MTDTPRVLVGLESEYAVSGTDGSGRIIPAGALAKWLFEGALSRPHLRGSEKGIFLGNGSRLYVDVGDHPEIACAEATSPWDAVRHALAGDRLTVELAQDVMRERPEIARLLVRKSNVDYGGATTYGSHENYLYACSPSRLRPALIPHLISRIVITGGGGFDPFEVARARFVLSPRALFVRRIIEASAPGEIALVDDREQSHCRGFHRQHVMCGDANRSHLAMLLRLGTTALVVGLIDADAYCGDDVRLADRAAALAAVTRDTTLRRRLALANGGSATAVEIQERYLAAARAHLDRLPAWAPALCALWEDTLDRLRRGPDAVADRLDWAIKLAVCRDHAARHRMRWASSRRRSAGAAVPSERDRQWRAQLMEVDSTFGQVFPSGPFEAIDEAGVLQHRIWKDDEIDRAVTAPPSEGRARLRAQVVTRLAADARSAGSICGWDFVLDDARRQRLDLSCPFTQTETWRELPPERPSVGALMAKLAHLVRSPASLVGTMAIRDVARVFSESSDESPAGLSGQHAVDVNGLGFELRHAGRLLEAEWLMRAALAIDLRVREPDHPKLSHRRNNLATVLLLQGRVAEARAESVRAWQQTAGRRDLTSARILFIRLCTALVEGESPDPFAGQLKTHLAIQPLPDFADVERRWQVQFVLETLAPQLDSETLDLLRAVAAVANGERSLESIATHPRWCDVPERSLEAGWPSAHPRRGGAERDRRR